MGGACRVQLGGWMVVRDGVAVGVPAAEPDWHVDQLGPYSGSTDFLWSSTASTVWVRSLTGMRQMPLTMHT